MTIQWFPGHMGKAHEQIAELMRRTDVIIEILDARLPFSSSNHLLETVRRQKPCIKLLNKQDLADPAVTRAWVRHFERQAGTRALPISAKQQGETKQLIKLCRSLVPKRGRPGWPIRAMVVGIPNVGKSTLINTLSGRSTAKVGDRPAVTTTTQQIDLGQGMVLFDTPGILWPDMNDHDGSYRLAASGAIGANALDPVTVAFFAVEYLTQRYPALLQARYKMESLPDNPTVAIETIGRCLGCLVAGGTVDMNRAAESFLRELRSGKLGRISLEEPPAAPPAWEAGPDAPDLSAP